MTGRNRAAIALVTARAARARDADLPPLERALRGAGAEVQIADWDDDAVNWASFDLALVRSTWDYTERLREFLTWVDRASSRTRLLNPPAVIHWNTDKHYLGALTKAGVPTVPSTFLEPGDSAEGALESFLARHGCRELVVKPSVGAGSRDTQRYTRGASGAAVAHARRLLDAERSVLLQPYLDRVDQDGETALIYYAGRFSHAIRKGPLLPPGAAAATGLFVPEEITPRVPGQDELELAGQVLSAIPFGVPLYARVDLIRDAQGAPCLLELELTEPALFFAHAPGSAERFATAVLEAAAVR